VHFLGHPCDMDAILALAEKHKLKVIEDVSHAQGGLYKGRKLGSIGHVSGISLMTGKSLAIGEGGILTTNDQHIYERAVAFGHYERFGGFGLSTRDENFVSEDLQPFYGLPLGGNKYRMHQMSSAVGRVQLKHYDQRVEEIRKASQYFWSLLEGVPGLHPHKTTFPESNMAAHYEARGHYRPEEVGGLSLTRVVEAMKAEGYSDCVPGLLRPLHQHPVFNEADVYHDGKPTRIAFSDRDLREKAEEFPVSSRLNRRMVTIPWFKHLWPEYIEEYALAFRKVLLQADQLLAGDPGDDKIGLTQGSVNMSSKQPVKK
jgi:perosamine synthetase